jgi:Outer membrane protein beta-barrel domain
MIKNVLIAFVLVVVFDTHHSYGQDVAAPTEKKSKGLPSIPGSFVLEFAFNQPYNKPDTFDIGFWGSRTLNLYYMYDMRIGHSKFSVHPGIGVSLERYKLKNNYTLADGSSGTDLIPGSDTYSGIKKSMVVTNFIEIPLEFRFSSKPDDPVHSFRVSIGGRVGYLFDSYTKINYKEGGEKKKIKDKENFNLSDFRYGLFFKLGAGNICLVSYYNISPIFKKDKGPEKTDMNNFTVGISLSSF